MPLVRLVPFLLCLALLAEVASAEPVRLASGKELEASKVEVVANGVRVTLSVSGGTARVTYPFERLDSIALIPLLDRHLMRGQDPTSDAQAALRIARLAFDAGLMVEAGNHFAQAAVLDPLLAKERDEGLAKVRDVEAHAALGELEELLRDGEAFAVLAYADALRDSPLGQVLTPVEGMRLKTLTAIAQKVVAKAAAQDAAEAAAPEGADPKPVDWLEGVDDETKKRLESVRAGYEQALAARDAASDPDISNRSARKHLEVAGRALLDARRTLFEIEPPISDLVAEAADAVRELLVTSYLDVAELYREEGEFDAARRWLRAASVLDPENGRVAEVRERIEQDLAAPYDEPPPWYGPVEAYTLYPGGILPYGYGRRGSFGYGHVRHHRRHGGFHFRAHYHSGHFHGGLRFHSR